jgi:hypothetical protein
MLAVNVNGLRDNKKRRDFLRLLKGQWDVILLTVRLRETHCPDDETAVRWMSEGAGPGQPWQGPAFWHPGTSRSRGVAVLLRSGYVCEDVKVDCYIQWVRPCAACPLDGSWWSAAGCCRSVCPQCGS